MTERTDTPILEWLAAIFGAAILIFLLIMIGGDLIYDTPGNPPDISVHITGMEPVAAGFVVAFEAKNHSDDTAAAVEIEGVLKKQDNTEETSTATLDYVPGNGQTKGGLLFTEKPDTGRLTLRATGFQRP